MLSDLQVGERHAPRHARKVFCPPEPVTFEVLGTLRLSRSVGDEFLSLVLLLDSNKWGSARSVADDPHRSRHRSRTSRPSPVLTVVIDARGPGQGSEEVAVA